MTSLGPPRIPNGIYHIKSGIASSHNYLACRQEGSAIFVIADAIANAQTVSYPPDRISDTDSYSGSFLMLVMGLTASWLIWTTRMHG